MEEDQLSTLAAWQPEQALLRRALPGRTALCAGLGLSKALLSSTHSNKDCSNKDHSNKDCSGSSHLNERLRALDDIAVGGGMWSGTRKGTRPVSTVLSVPL